MPENYKPGYRHVSLYRDELGDNHKSYCTIEELLRAGAYTYQEKINIYVAYQLRELIELGDAALKECGVRREVDGSYVLVTKVKGEDGYEQETVRTLAPSDYLIRNTVDSEGANWYSMSETKFAGKYLEGGDHLYEPSSRGFFIVNPWGEPIVIDASWGEPQYGEKGCYVVVALERREFCEHPEPESPVFWIDGEEWVVGDRYLIAADEAAETYRVVEGGPRWPR